MANNFNFNYPKLTDAADISKINENFQKVEEYDFSSIVEVVDNLDSSDATKALSANQGRVLKEKIEKAAQAEEKVPFTVSASGWTPEKKYTYSNPKLTQSTDADLEVADNINDAQLKVITLANISMSISLAAGAIVLTAIGDVPKVDIPLQLKVRSW